MALLIAVLVAPMLSSLDQAFQYIQEFTGFVSPGILVIFMFGLFWKRATPNSALWAAILTLPLSAGFKYFAPEMAFLDRMGLIFVILSLIVIFISLYEKKGEDPKAIHLNRKLFETNSVFNVAAVGICAILSVFYILFW